MQNIPTPTADASLQLQSSQVVKSLKPLIFNFFVSERPEDQQQTLEDLDNNSYRAFHSQKLQVRNGHFFRPTMQFKKIVDQPKFLLSVERKKIKIMKGISQKASSEKPSRSSYRGKKLKTTPKTMVNQEDIEQPEAQTKNKRIQSLQQKINNNPASKTKQPHLHFNLRFILQSRRNFTGEFSRADNITGSSYPYFNYFSSSKSSVPQSERSSIYRSARKCDTHQVATRSGANRLLLTTVNLGSKPFYQSFD